MNKSSCFWKPLAMKTFPKHTVSDHIDLGSLCPFSQAGCRAYQKYARPFMRTFSELWRTHDSRAAKRGRCKRGGFPDLDLSFLFCPFLSFLGLSRFFRDFPDLLGESPGIFPDSSLFLFLGLLRAPTRNSPERVRDTIWTFPEKVGNPPVWKPPGLASLKQYSVSRRGGRNKGGRKQMRANANKRRQTLTNASKRRGENVSKRKQTRANVDKRKQTLTPPFIAVFYTPLCNPLKYHFHENLPDIHQTSGEGPHSPEFRWSWLLFWPHVGGLQNVHNFPTSP